MNGWTQSRPAWLAAGLTLGLIVGLNAAGLWPSIPLHASATEGLDKFAFATGLVDQEVEALYFLDFLTGDLTAAVINPKTGKFNSKFTRNIAADFGAAGKGTRYMIVTGSPTCRAAATTSSMPRASSTSPRRRPGRWRPTRFLGTRRFRPPGKPQVDEIQAAR